MVHFCLDAKATRSSCAWSSLGYGAKFLAVLLTVTAEFDHALAVQLLLNVLHDTVLCVWKQ